MSYNGWKNYETWCMALWIDNDEGSYERSREIVSEADPVIYPAWCSTDGDKRSYYTGCAAAVLHDWCEEAMYDWEPESASVFTDLLHSAFGEIDWYEIAENYLSELVA